MPVAGTECDGNRVPATAGTSSLVAAIDVELDNDSDYGWDLSLDGDALELLDSAAALTAVPLHGPVVPEAAHCDAATLLSFGGSLVAPVSLASGELFNLDPVAGSNATSAIVSFDATALDFEAETSNLSQSVTKLTGESSSDDDFVSKDGKYTAKPYLGPEKILRTQSAKSATSFADSQDASCRSPLARFRSAPKKPLSVSDLVAGAWCELQYEYTLTRLPGGRPRRSAAMKAGTSLHKKLEDQVHTAVPIAVATKEDLMAVRIFNMIQGLATLREFGLTREFDLVGVIDTGVGADDERYQVVNGVIDALSYETPDLEDVCQSGQKLLAGNRLHSRATVPLPDTPAVTAVGARITDYFSSQHPRSSSEPQLHEEQPPHKGTGKIYISDVKTRASLQLPTATAARPSRIQLFLYHQFLSDLAANRLSFARVFERFGVNPLQPLSSSFLAELTAGELLGDDSGLTATDLNGFVDLLNREVAKTFPQGADSIGDVVAIEYRQRASNTQAQHHGRCLGTIVVPVDRPLLDRYLSNYLEWWRGLRPAVGVDIEDAGLKCRNCDFAEDCDWRSGLDQERMNRARAKMAMYRQGSKAGEG
ncbi:hypothetical protein SEPCBS119000_004248 [Sporothrix epigloea]|uniref:Defects in morphology protein 1 n=1 Tax=Sporothrix epigloea TaxID=1892477 RepID=A0ABP0DR60_9PEZI